MPDEKNNVPISGWPAGYADRIARLLTEDLEGFATFALDDQGTVLGWNRGAERLLGYAEAEIIGGDAAVFFAPEDPPMGERVPGLRTALEAGRSAISLWLVRKDGSRFSAIWILYGVGAKPRERPCLLVMARGLTEPEIQERQMRMGDGRLAALSRVLRESDARCRAMIEAVEDAVFFVDGNGRILTWNRGARQRLGFSREEIAGKGWTLLLSGSEPDREEGVRRLAAAEAETNSEDGIRWESQVVRKDGTRFWAEIAIASIRDDPDALRGYCVVIHDLTRRRVAEDALRAAEEQLRQIQKMDAIGRLAGGVAHDFNNLLTVILGFTELGVGMIEAGHPARAVLEEIGKAGRTAAQLTRNLLAVSRKQPLAPVVLDLNAIVEESTAMLRRLVGSGIQFSTRLAPAGTALVRADRGMLGQILLNLAVNAKDAMPEGGTLTVETRATDLSEPMQCRQGSLPPGRYATLIVADSGTGMSEAIKSHLFEPFFTTKEKGKGTGLGLSTTYGIVRQSGGEIAVVSEPGFGTAFFIHFPLVAGSIDEGPHPEAAEPIARAKGEKILVVDDEEMVRKFIASVLENAGYRVRTAASGREALEAREREAGNFDLLLTDIVMPGLNGLDLAERVRAAQPDIKIVIMSGYPADVDMGEALARNDFLFLGKPFTPEAILKTMQDALRPKALP